MVYYIYIGVYGFNYIHLVQLSFIKKVIILFKKGLTFNHITF